MLWQEGMKRELYMGTLDELVAYARQFEKAGADLLTVTLIDPPGPDGIEQLAPLVDALSA